MRQRFGDGRDWFFERRYGMFGLREARGDVPASALRLRGLPVDRITDEPLVVKLRVPGLPETPGSEAPGGPA